MHDKSRSPLTNQVPPALLTGSYQADDCQFLLQAIDVSLLTVEEKERQLQSGKKHYSQMISSEQAPNQQYLELFYNLVSQYKSRLANEICQLAKQIFLAKGRVITLLSLARAGTPIGVLLTRALRYHFQADVKHFSISIIRDRGLDVQALQYIKTLGVPAESIVFVDGWTAKGVITDELRASINQWNQIDDYQIPNQLCVVSDICGVADFIATHDDYAIPSGILNSTVSGLISRTLLLNEYQGFHQCVIYKQLEQYDLSNWFIDEISALFAQASFSTIEYNEKNSSHRRAVMMNYVNSLMTRFNVMDINRIKPGIAEATRVMLRRIPRILLVRDQHSSDIRHLRLLSSEKNIPVIEDPHMPFNAAAIIADAKN